MWKLVKQIWAHFLVDIMLVMAGMTTSFVFLLWAFNGETQEAIRIISGLLSFLCISIPIFIIYKQCKM